MNTQDRRVTKGLIFWTVPHHSVTKLHSWHWVAFVSYPFGPKTCKSAAYLLSASPGLHKVSAKLGSTRISDSTSGAKPTLRNGTGSTQPVRDGLTPKSNPTLPKTTRCARRSSTRKSHHSHWILWSFKRRQDKSRMMNHRACELQIANPDPHAGKFDKIRGTGSERVGAF